MWGARVCLSCWQNEDGLVEYFEAALRETRKEPRKVIGWVANELLGHLKLQDMRVSQRWDMRWRPSPQCESACSKQARCSCYFMVCDVMRAWNLTRPCNTPVDKICSSFKGPFLRNPQFLLVIRAAPQRDLLCLILESNLNSLLNEKKTKVWNSRCFSRPQHKPCSKRCVWVEDGPLISSENEILHHQNEVEGKNIRRTANHNIPSVHSDCQCVRSKFSSFESLYNKESVAIVWRPIRDSFCLCVSYPVTC